MSGIARMLGIGKKKNSDRTHRSSIGKLIMASRAAVGIPDSAGKHGAKASYNARPGNSLFEASHDARPGNSLFENSGPRLFDEEPPLSLLVSPKPEFDPNIAVFSGVRHDRVEDLTRRVTVSLHRPFYEGGYSWVWKGMLDNTQLVAIKGVKDQRIRPEKARRRLKRQIGTWWCLRHENVVPLLGMVYDDTFGTSAAMVSPWYENGSAVSYLSNPERPISIADRIDLFYGVANGINYLHTFDTTKITEEPPTGSEHESNSHVTGIVHGDLKPLNILIDDHGVPKLCGFSLLRLIQDGPNTSIATTSRHTGTTRYLSYELVVEDDYDVSEISATTASDVHALACVGLEFIYSMPPYAHIHSPSRLDYKISRAIENKVPPAVRPDGISGVESTLWDLFEQCWSIEPKDRPDAVAICEYFHNHWNDLITTMRK